MINNITMVILAQVICDELMLAISCQHHGCRGPFTESLLEFADYINFRCEEVIQKPADDFMSDFVMVFKTHP